MENKRGRERRSATATFVRGPGVAMRENIPMRAYRPTSSDAYIQIHRCVHTDRDIPKHAYTNACMKTPTAAAGAMRRKDQRGNRVLQET